MNMDAMSTARNMFALYVNGHLPAVDSPNARFATYLASGSTARTDLAPPPSSAQMQFWAGVAGKYARPIRIDIAEDTIWTSSSPQSAKEVVLPGVLFSTGRDQTGPGMAFCLFPIYLSYLQRDPSEKNRHASAAIMEVYKYAARNHDPARFVATDSRPYNRLLQVLGVYQKQPQDFITATLRQVRDTGMSGPDLAPGDVVGCLQIHMPYDHLRYVHAPGPQPDRAQVQHRCAEAILDDTSNSGLLRNLANAHDPASLLPGPAQGEPSAISTPPTTSGAKPWRFRVNERFPMSIPLLIWAAFRAPNAEVRIVCEVHTLDHSPVFRTADEVYPLNEYAAPNPRKVQNQKNKAHKKRKRDEMRELDGSQTSSAASSSTGVSASVEAMQPTIPQNKQPKELDTFSGRLEVRYRRLSGQWQQMHVTTAEHRYFTVCDMQEALCQRFVAEGHVDEIEQYFCEDRNTKPLHDEFPERLGALVLGENSAIAPWYLEALRAVSVSLDPAPSDEPTNEVPDGYAWFDTMQVEAETIDADDDVETGPDYGGQDIGDSSPFPSSPPSAGYHMQLNEPAQSSALPVPSTPLQIGRHQWASSTAAVLQAPSTTTVRSADATISESKSSTSAKLVLHYPTALSEDASNVCLTREALEPPFCDPDINTTRSSNFKSTNKRSTDAPEFEFGDRFLVHDLAAHGAASLDTNISLLRRKNIAHRRGHMYNLYFWQYTVLASPFSIPKQAASSLMVVKAGQTLPDLPEIGYEDPEIEEIKRVYAQSHRLRDPVATRPRSAENWPEYEALRTTVNQKSLLRSLKVPDYKLVSDLAEHVRKVKKGVIGQRTYLIAKALANPELRKQIARVNAECEETGKPGFWPPVWYNALTWRKCGTWDGEPAYRCTVDDVAGVGFMLSNHMTHMGPGSTIHFGVSDDKAIQHAPPLMPSLAIADLVLQHRDLISTLPYPPTEHAYHKHRRLPDLLRSIEELQALHCFSKADFWMIPPLSIPYWTAACAQSSVSLATLHVHDQPLTTIVGILAILENLTAMFLHNCVAARQDDSLEALYHLEFGYHFQVNSPTINFRLGILSITDARPQCKIGLTDVEVDVLHQIAVKSREALSTLKISHGYPFVVLQQIKNSLKWPVSENMQQATYAQMVDAGECPGCKDHRLKPGPIDSESR